MKIIKCTLARMVLATGYVALGLMSVPNTACWGQAAPAADAQTPAVNLPPGVSDVVKLTKIGMGEDIILTQVKGLGPLPPLTTDQIVYLANVGVSQNVIKAIQAKSSAVAAAPAPTDEPKPSATYPGPSPSPAAPSAQTVSSTPVVASYPAPAPEPVAVVQPQYNPPPAPAPVPAQPSVVSLAISSNTPWADTGIDLAMGDNVTVVANGIISLSKHFPGMKNFEGPDGNPLLVSINIFQPFVAPGLPPWALVGKVSESGAPFKVGSSTVFVAPAAGRLYLSVNANEFGGNNGNFNVVLTLPAPAQPVVAVPVAPPVEVNFDYFHEQLAPFGNWIDVAGFGWCWNPTVATQNPFWRPYADQGHWAYTENGLFWQSEYPWGDIVFHYGRWTYGAGYGWLWVPDYNWGPAWVCWRHAESEGYAGWAPLPPGATFVPGVGLMYNGVLAVDIDFGMPADAFVFVGYNHFWDNDYHGAFIPRDRAAYFYGRSEVRNGYRYEGGRFRAEGVGRERLGEYSHHDVRAVDTRELRHREETAHFEQRRENVYHEAHAVNNRGEVIRKGPAPISAHPATVAKPGPKAPTKPAGKPEEKKTL